jgi:hypothetical protein
MRNLFRTGLVIALLSGCATIEPVSYSDVLARNQPMLKAPRLQVAPVLNDIHPQCDDDTETCVVTFRDMELIDFDTRKLQEVVKKLNAELEELTDTYNRLVMQFTTCEYSNEKWQQAVQLQEQSAARNEFIAAGKQVMLAGACGLLLLGM